MIHSIKLRHWKSHESSRLEFGKGTNLLIGPMGSGKTSVLDAICFALFGTFPALKSRKVSLEEVVMARPERKTDASVELTFECEGQKYTVVRSLSPEKSEAYLRKGEQVVEGPQPQRTTEAIQSVIRMDYELFTRAVYAEQNRVDHFLQLQPRERKRQIDELLGLDSFETARATSVQALNKLKAQREEADKLLKGMGYEETKRLASSLQAELKALRAESAAAGGEAARAGRDAEAAKADVARLEKLEASHREAEKRATALEARLKESKEEAEKEKAALGALPSEGEARKEKERLSREIAELEGRAKAGRELSLAREKISGSLEALAQEKKSKSGLEGRLYEDEAQALKRLESDRAARERKVEEARARMEGAQKALAKAQARCGELAEKARERASLVEQLRELEKRHGENIKERLAKAGEKAKELQTLIAQAQARAEEAQSAHETLAGAGAGCPVCDTPLTEERRKGLAEQKSAKRRESLEKKTAHEAQLRELGAGREELEKALKRQEIAEARLSALGGAEEELLKERQEEKRAAAALEGARKDEGSIREAVKAAGDAEERQRQLVRSLGELAALLAKEARHRTELQRIEGQLGAAAVDKVEAELKAAREKLAGFERIARVHELQRRANELDGELAKARKDFASIGFSPTALIKARETAAEAHGRTAGAQARVEKARALEKEKEARLEEAGARVKAGQAAEERRLKVEREEEQVAVFGKALVETQSALRSELIDGVNDAMALLWRGLYPYRDYLSVRLSGSGEDYDIELRSLDGEWVQIEQASGGEKSCAALCLRIAFATVLAPCLSWLVLDEPTHNLDSNAVLLLAHALRDEIPKIVDQVFIITHDEALKESASARVYRIERDKDRGDKSAVEEVSIATVG